MRIPVFNSEGTRTSEILEFDEKIFGEEVRKAVLKEYILMYEARQRQGTHSTKGRAEVAGSGRKLWRQKGTGRARVGAARAPHWKGGGIVFGPKPRDYSYTMPKKARKAAMKSAWLAKFQDREVVVIDNFDLGEKPKAAAIRKLFGAMDLGHKRLMIGTKDHNKNLHLSTRNFPNIDIDRLEQLNPFVVVANERVILTREAFEELIKSHGGEIKSCEREKLYS